MREFISMLLCGSVTFSRHADFKFAYDRCRYGAWNYHAFYCVFFKVVVSK